MLIILILVMLLGIIWFFFRLGLGLVKVGVFIKVFNGLLLMMEDENKLFNFFVLLLRLLLVKFMLFRGKLLLSVIVGGKY